MDLRVLERPLIRGCAVVVSKCQQSALFKAGLLQKTVSWVTLKQREGKKKEARPLICQKDMHFLVLKSCRMWISAFQLESDSFGDVTAFLLTQPAYTFCNTLRKKKKRRQDILLFRKKKNLPVLSSLCNQEAAFCTSCMNTWSS